MLAAGQGDVTGTFACHSPHRLGATHEDESATKNGSEQFQMGDTLKVLPDP